MSAELNALPTILALAVLVKRLGGEVSISQGDIDDIAYSRLLEGFDERGNLILKTQEREKQ